ncbi:MAG: ribonuclease E/G, partial [Acidobacteriota bacterium]|nr:ribonuclease E/G [Acidobacteriota bacterium]
MNKEMIISSSGHETMAAILEDDEVVEISVERDKSRGVVGNIYKGRVKKILPGMQCAFVDLGLERDGFLYVSDVIDPVDSLDGVDTSDTDGDIDIPAAGNGGHGSGNGSGRSRGRGRSRNTVEQKIEQLLTAGQEVIVQVVKEPLGTKGARITSHVTIPGRFLVFMPTVDHIGVSRKIVSREQRVRLRRIVREFRSVHGLPGGVIIRRAAADRPK